MLKKAIRLIKDHSIFAPVLFMVDVLLLSVDLLATIRPRKRNPNKIGIIKLDKLGDYILIRNFFDHIRESKKYKGHHFTLIANIEIKNFAEYLDGGKWDNIIWVDIYKYSSNLFYRFKMSGKIYREGFQTIIAPTYARVFVLEDLITLVSGAKNRIGQTAHSINMKRLERYIGDHFYTSLVSVSNEVIFEFERNRLFFENVIGEGLSAVNLQINYQPKENIVSAEYVVLMPGAADSHRQWSSENFTRLADHLTIEKGLAVILCGAPSERAIGEDIMKHASNPDKVKNEIGSLKMSVLFDTFHHSQFIVSNETGAVHLCAAMDKSVFCISNGNHFGKYTEYPLNLSKKVHYIYPNEIDALMFDKRQIAQMFDYRSNLDINSITIGKVQKEISTASKRH
jgi:ADP-heptose:LPS heptosyltransferase